MRASESTHQYNVENQLQTNERGPLSGGRDTAGRRALASPAWPALRPVAWNGRGLVGAQEGQMELRCGGSPGSGARLRVNPRAGQHRALCSADSERRTCQALVKSGPGTQTQATRPQSQGLSHCSTPPIWEIPLAPEIPHLAVESLLFWGKTDTEGRKLLSGKWSWRGGELEGHPSWREGGGQGERRRHGGWARVWEEHALSNPLQAGRARSEYSSMIAVLPVTAHQSRVQFQIWGRLSIFHLDRDPEAALRPLLTHTH